MQYIVDIGLSSVNRARANILIMKSAEQKVDIKARKAGSKEFTVRKR